MRPFEWGLDWLLVERSRSRQQRALGAGSSSSAGSTRPCRTRQRSSCAADARLRLRAVAASRRAQKGEAGTLSFPSALTRLTPRTTWSARAGFPRRQNRHSAPRTGRGRAVVVLPQWNADAEGHVGSVTAAGALRRLRAAPEPSLPRCADASRADSRADYIVSSNVVRTVQVCRQAVLDARRAVAWLAAQGFERIGILGTSLGSCLRC